MFFLFIMLSHFFHSLQSAGKDVPLQAADVIIQLSVYYIYTYIRTSYTHLYMLLFHPFSSFISQP